MAKPVDGMVRGISCGTLASTATILPFILLSVTGPLDWVALYVIPAMAIAILMTALILISLTALLVGYPLVWLLGRIDCACAQVGASLGAMIGASLFLLPALIDGLRPDYLFILMALSGLVGGGITGWIWGEGQEAVGNGDADPPHPNRYADERILR